eukprot:1745367-Amphidinium_carterae.2
MVKKLVWGDRGGDGVAEAIEEFAKQCGVDTHQADGLPLFTGHSMRVEGAQQMARARSFACSGAGGLT